MKLLIVTQAVDLDDPVLGFFHRWIEEFARNAERVEVICLKQGRAHLPENVRLHSLGKESGKRSRFRYAYRFLSLTWSLHRSYDAVFVHMNPEYLFLSGWLWRLMGKRVGLWYTHGTISWRLRCAVTFAHLVFTASNQSLRLSTQKKRVTGHGLDLELFSPVPPPAMDDRLLFISIGRSSRVKRTDLMQAAVTKARELGINAHFSLVHDVSHDQIPGLLAEAHIFLHASATGSLDKAPLEALALGVPIVTTNAELGAVGNPAILFCESTPEAMAQKIKEAVESVVWRKEEVRRAARAYIERTHSLTGLVPRLVQALNRLSAVPAPREFYNTVMPGKLGEDYEKARWHSNPLQEAQYQMTRETIERIAIPLFAESRSLLEVGPGAGTWTKVLLSALPNIKFTLLDISSEMLSRARNTLSCAPDISYIEKDLADFRAETSYDGFFSSRALEYMPNRTAAVKSIYQAMSSGAPGMIITKMPKPVFDWLRGRDNRAFHSGMITPRACVAALRKEGFTIEQVRIATATFPGLNAPRLNIALFTLLKHLPLLFPLTVFAESYCVTFRKP